MSDLRHRIVKAFRENGIEMPYAQHDVHLRDLDFVKTLVQRVQDVRTAEPARSTGAKPPAPDATPPRAAETTAVEPEPQPELRIKRRS